MLFSGGGGGGATVADVESDLPEMFEQQRRTRPKTEPPKTQCLKI
jgi:hypothetical protein